MIDFFLDLDACGGAMFLKTPGSTSSEHEESELHDYSITFYSYEY